MVIYYLVARRGMSLKGAYHLVKAPKPNVRPNFGFCKQLQMEEIRLRGEQSLDMDEYKAGL